MILLCLILRIRGHGINSLSVQSNKDMTCVTMARVGGSLEIKKNKNK